MGIVGDFFGDTAADAASSAAAAQAHGIKKGKKSIRAAADEAQAFLSPFAAEGRSALSGLSDLITNPQAQLDFITSNPFFDALADDAEDRLFNNQAAVGKVGSGGTAEALQNSLLLLGADLLGQNISQRQGLANLGFNAAQSQADVAITEGVGLANLNVGKGAVLAAGKIGEANAEAEGTENFLSAAGGLAGIALCDKRTKEDIRRVGIMDNGLPVYMFKYKGSDQIHVNVMAQDVEKVMPDAVIQVDGLKYVDMGAIWQA